MRDIVLEMKERRKHMAPIDKLGWYYRYWPSMKLDRAETVTFTEHIWDDFIANDPIFNKKKRV